MAKSAPPKKPPPFQAGGMPKGGKNAPPMPSPNKPPKGGKPGKY